MTATTPTDERYRHTMFRTLLRNNRGDGTMSAISAALLIVLTVAAIASIGYAALNLLTKVNVDGGILTELRAITASEQATANGVSTTTINGENVLVAQQRVDGADGSFTKVAAAGGLNTNVRDNPALCLSSSRDPGCLYSTTYHAPDPNKLVPDSDLPGVSAFTPVSVTNASDRTIFTTNAEGGDRDVRYMFKVSAGSGTIRITFTGGDPINIAVEAGKSYFGSIDAETGTIEFIANSPTATAAAPLTFSHMEVYYGTTKQCVLLTGTQTASQVSVKTTLPSSYIAYSFNFAPLSAQLAWTQSIGGVLDATKTQIVPASTSTQGIEGKTKQLSAGNTVVFKPSTGAFPTINEMRFYECAM